MRLIDADALLGQAGDNFRQASRDGCDHPMYPVVEETIMEAPAADVVKVVRCGQCVHFGNFHDCHYHKADENGTPIFVRENDFCSYGERKEGAD